MVNAVAGLQGSKSLWIGRQKHSTQDGIQFPPLFYCHQVTSRSCIVSFLHCQYISLQTTHEYIYTADI